MNKKSNRRVLREKALQVLYAFRMNNEGLEKIIAAMLIEIDNDTDKTFCRELILKVLANQKELEATVKEKVANWEMDRIAIIDKILLQIGIAEILYFPDIPPKVSINEAIEIAKDYSTANSGKFINGILDAILSDLKNSGKLNKVGRGLIEDSIPKKPSK
ncbi:MAG: transcription antitermination factor NusB [Bacteroidetes bacterium]|nr:transcription antitermination factor NusB [Bacteroidota bacterium]MBU1680386.1 transcription antitermination factor NusB [Bacteroidota bacterium]